MRYARFIGLKLSLTDVVFIVHCWPGIHITITRQNRAIARFCQLGVTRVNQSINQSVSRVIPEIRNSTVWRLWVVAHKWGNKEEKVAAKCFIYRRTHSSVCMSLTVSRSVAILWRSSITRTQAGWDCPDDLDAPGFITSSKTRVSHRPLFGIQKFQGGMEQRNIHRL